MINFHSINVIVYIGFVTLLSTQHEGQLSALLNLSNVRLTSCLLQRRNLEDWEFENFLLIRCLKVTC